VNCKQKEIFIVFTTGSFNYTCMIFILRETRTAVHEWACCLEKTTNLPQITDNIDHGSLMT